MTAATKELVRRFWEEAPCGTRAIEAAEGTRAFFDRLDRDRERTQPFIERYARFGDWGGRRVLEVGVGPGTDLVRFARAGAIVTGVDLTDHAVQLARRRLELEGVAGSVERADAERLPFPDGSFDFVYSWGVVHHTPEPESAAREIVRVTKPGGEFCVMLYHRRSLVALQTWIVNGLLRGRPGSSLRELIASHHESVGTRAYTRAEARRLFPHVEQATVTPVVTAYDVRLTRTLYAPRWVQSLLPARLGWFLVVQGRKASR